MTCLVLGVLLLMSWPRERPATRPATSKEQIKAATLEVMRPWTGDLDGMIKRRAIRVATTYNKTLYFIDKGVQRGAVYEAYKLFEDELNAKLKTKHLRVNVVFIPVSRDELLQGGRRGPRRHRGGGADGDAGTREDRRLRAGDLRQHRRDRGHRAGRAGHSRTSTTCRDRRCSSASRAATTRA